MPTTISSINSSGILSTLGEIDEVTLSSGSIYFNGSSALSFTANSALAFGSGAYTVELWYNPSADYSGLTNGYLFDHADNQTRVQLWQNRVRYFYNTGGTGTELASPTDGLGLTVGTWYHLAIVRNSANLITMYINGVGVASVTSAVDENQTSFTIGQSGGSGSRFNGYISNFRIVKGVAVYTGNFTRPTMPLTAVPFTSLLLNNSYQGAFVDTSGNNLQFTQVGTPVSSTVTPPFLTKTESVSVSMVYSYKSAAVFDEVGLADSKNSIYFNGSSALTFTANSAFEFGVGAYTVEMWYNPSADYSGLTNGYLFDHANNQTRVQLWQNRVRYFYNTGGSGTELASPTDGLGLTIGTWYHLAIVRNSSNLITMYINGVGVASVTSSVYESQQDFTIGQAGNGTSKFTGYISNFRLVKGVAVYTSNFTPSLAPLLPINSTQLLLNYSYLTNSIVDKSSNNFSVTSVGTPTGSTQTPFNSTTVHRITPSAIQVLGYFDEYSLTNYDPIIYDPYFKNTVLLLTGDGTNGAQNNTIVDTSGINTVTSVGSPAKGSFTPFYPSKWSAYFNGSTDYITTPSNTALALGTGAFTVEFWVYRQGTGTTVIMDCATSGQFGFWITDTALTPFITQSTIYPISYSITNNMWNHIAIVRIGTGANQTTVYVNGVVAGVTTISANFTSPDVCTFGRSPAGSNYMNGYISNLRIVKGTAVYPVTFTTPTTELTSITNTSLLIFQNSRFLDNSSNAIALTAAGNVSANPFSPFVTATAYNSTSHDGSIYFNGSTDYLSIPNNASHATLAGDFTVECWFYLTRLTGNQTIISHRLGSTGTNGHVPFLLWAESTLLKLYVSSNNSSWNVINSATLATIASSQWYHLVYTRSGSSCTVFLNGAIVYSFTSAVTFTTVNSLQVGAAGSDYLQGYISNVRVVNGTSVYTSAFTPPTSPLTSITNTKLLLLSQNDGVINYTAKNNVSTVGNASINTTIKKYGTGSIYLDGTGDYLTIPTSGEFIFGTGDFTVECWVYPISWPNDVGIVTGPNSGSFQFGKVSTTSFLGIASNDANGWYISDATLPSLNIWTHIAVSRSGTTLRIFVNGVISGTPATSNTTNFGIINYIGRNAAGTSFNGYIDDLRITKGVARYTANFTPLTTSYLLK